MATIINNPAVESSESSSVALIIGIFGIIVLVGLFVVYLLPGLRNTDQSAGTTTEIKIDVPTPIPTPAP